MYYVDNPTFTYINQYKILSIRGLQILTVVNKLFLTQTIRIILLFTLFTVDKHQF